MDYLQRAIELSRASFEAGQFPAGAVLVTKSGGVYESKPSLPHNHGETMVIDMAIAAEGAPLVGATMYGSMQPCLMCTSKMYWAGIENAQYVLSKKDVRADYAYENVQDTGQVATTFFKPIKMEQSYEFKDEAMGIYSAWVKKIENHG
jgi:tRNA(Arg) A34 adenosine deaminase TadA